MKTKRQKKRVLLCEDDPAIRDVVVELLTSEGYHVGTTVDGVDCLNLVASGWQPDLVIMDLLLPRMAGATAITHLRQRPETKHVPIIAVSASENFARVTLPEATRVVTKPFDASSLLSMVSTLLGLNDT